MSHCLNNIELSLCGKNNLQLNMVMSDKEIQRALREERNRKPLKLDKWTDMIRPAIGIIIGYSCLEISTWIDTWSGDWFWLSIFFLILALIFLIVGAYPLLQENFEQKYGVDGQGIITSREVNSSRFRKPIRQKVKDQVWNRDGGQCVQCGSNENLEFDHIIPHSKGGADTYRNLQLLCQPCNGSKSNKIG